MGAWEILLVLSIILVLFGAKHPSGMASGLRRGLDQFGRAIKDLRNELDQDAIDAGKSFGGIYGKPAAQALSVENQTAELYRPTVFNRPLPRGTRATWLKRSATAIKALFLRLMKTLSSAIKRTR